MKIIVEGPDGAGKTTLVNEIAEKYGLNKVVFTKNGYKTFMSYMRYLDLSHVVFDRCFISELIYAPTFNRHLVVDDHEIPILLRAYLSNSIVIILNSDEQTLKQRLVNRGDEEKAVIDKIGVISKSYENLAKNLHLPTFDIEDKEAIFKYIDERIKTNE